jgi:transcriptional/translational regulatory protein YebC/TACO1
MYFNRSGGSLGTQGSLDFLFTRMGVFQINAEGQDMGELEMDLIDFGAEEIGESDGIIFVYTSFENFGKMQKVLDEKGIMVINAELQRIPVTSAELNSEQEDDIIKLIDKIEEDDDVTNVFHNMK